MRNANVQVSTATTNTTEPDREAASRDAIESPEANHGHPFDIVPEAQLAAYPRFQTRCRNTSRGDGYDRVDVACCKVRRRESLAGGGDEHCTRALDVSEVSFGPSRRLEIPLDRPDGIAAPNSRGFEHPCQLFEIAKSR
ncbi:hypothetical protein JOH51_007428 [Rhizobium leguminosarum]|nr:hypothetical protein [Rhizobium leguminosarum]